MYIIFIIFLTVYVLICLRFGYLVNVLKGFHQWPLLKWFRCIRLPSCGCWTILGGPPLWTSKNHTLLQRRSAISGTFLMMNPCWFYENRWVWQDFQGINSSDHKKDFPQKSIIFKASGLLNNYSDTTCSSRMSFHEMKF